MADIFISYKKENRLQAERFMERFAQLGFSVWWDDHITPRESWDETIEREIAAATCVVVLWSPLAVQSDWVRKEVHYGHTHRKLVPVMIERCALPLAFSLVQTVNLCDWDGSDADRRWRKLLTWISDLKVAHASPDAVGKSPANPFRTAIGQLASGEPIVDGTLVSTATPTGTLFRDHPDAPVMRIVPAGDFLLGAAPNDSERSNVEGPQKRIDIGQPLAVGVYPVSHAEYRRFGPARVEPPPKPVLSGWFSRRVKAIEAPPVVAAPGCAATGVSFEDARLFAQALSRAVEAAYRLPSEAEWEYACRAGTRGRYSWGDDIDASRALYRYKDDAPTGPCPPGRFPANPFGLHDMHGNVREWTEDTWFESYEHVPLDGRPVSDGHSSMRVTRGGGWFDPPSMLRSSARGRATQSVRSDVIGLRVVRAL